jgi:hypothetical protein
MRHVWREVLEDKGVVDVVGLDLFLVGIVVGVVSWLLLGVK